jgi:hypothetical protein
MVFREERLEEVGNPLLGHSRAPHTGKPIDGRLAGLEGKNTVFQVSNWSLALVKYALVAIKYVANLFQTDMKGSTAIVQRRCVEPLYSRSSTPTSRNLTGKPVLGRFYVQFIRRCSD